MLRSFKMSMIIVGVFVLMVLLTPVLGLPVAGGLYWVHKKYNNQTLDFIITFGILIIGNLAAVGAMVVVWPVVHLLLSGFKSTELRRVHCE